MSRMTPRLLILEEGATVKLSMVIEKLLVFDSVDFVPMSRISVLLLFNLRKLRVNQFFISVMQLVREVGGRVDEGLVVR